jgi:hypothetical protein
LLGHPHLFARGVQVSIAITEQKLLHIDLSANSDSAIIGGPVGALAFEHLLKTFSRLMIRGVRFLSVVYKTLGV